METLTAPVLAPAEPTTPIKPSEALRLGRLTVPTRIEGTNFDGVGGACARGAILAGLGSTDFIDLYVRWPEFNRPLSCPTLSCSVEGVGGPVMTLHLNDQHHWSDDQIVAWLESLGL